MKQNRFIWIATALWTVSILVCSLVAAVAAEPIALNPTGTWNLVTINPETGKRSSETPMKLKLEGGKLSGSITHQSTVNGKTRVTERVLKDGKLQGDSVSFTVSFPPVAGQGPEVTQAYQGRLTGDSMKGKLESEWNDNIFKREWQATRIKE